MNIATKHIRNILLIVVLSSTFSCREEFNEFITDIESETIADYIYENNERFKYFIQIAEQANIMDALKAYNPNGNYYTLFLPDDEAFEDYFLSVGTYQNIEDILNNLDFTSVFARYHVLNTQIRSNDFPFGAFPDTTLSGDVLTVGYSVELDSTIYLINNVSAVSKKNIETKNGYIHEIEMPLIPVVNSSYELLASYPEFSILSETFELTGLNEKMGLTIETPEGKTIKNLYTLWAEPDSIYNKKGIFTIDDLIEQLSPDDNNYTSEDNPLFQFAAYHIMEGQYFLDNFEGATNYSTFASLPLMISSGLKLKINPDKNRIFDTLVVNMDTSYVDYIEPYYSISNILSKNGPIHFINQILRLYKPSISSKRFQFYEEPALNSASNNPNTYYLTNSDDFTVLSWSGVEEIIYFKSSTEIKAWGNDYIQAFGDFTVTYTIPKILPGTYTVIFKADAHDNNNSNAVVELFIDGNKQGGNINLTTGANASNPFKEFNQNTIEFSSYETHIVTVKTLLPGMLIWDGIVFNPI